VTVQRTHWRESAGCHDRLFRHRIYTAPGMLGKVPAVYYDGAIFLLEWLSNIKFGALSPRE